MKARERAPFTQNKCCDIQIKSLHWHFKSIDRPATTLGIRRSKNLICPRDKAKGR